MKGIIKGLVLAIPLAVLCASSFAAGKWIGQHKKVMKWTPDGQAFSLRQERLPLAWPGRRPQPASPGCPPRG